MRSLQLIHLHRQDRVTSGGWSVRLPPWHPLGPKTIYFADAHHGGKHGSLRAARERRDALFAEAGLPLRLGGHMMRPDRKVPSASKLVGVRLTKLMDRGRPLYYWLAVWREGQERRERRMKFSVTTLGYERAFWAAVDLRQRKSGLLFTNEAIRDALAAPRPADIREPACNR